MKNLLNVYKKFPSESDLTDKAYPQFPANVKIRSKQGQIKKDRGETSEASL